MTNWPDPPGEDLELKKILYTAQVSEAAGKRKAEDPPGGLTDNEFTLDKASWDAERDLYKTYYQAVIDTAKGAIDRARARAELIEKAAAAIAALYTGVLALVFSVEKNQLPLRGVVPTLFLGLAIVLAMVYLAYLTPSGYTEAPNPHSSHRVAENRRLWFFVSWVSTAVLQRTYFLRASVVSLGVGAALLPLPFIHLPEDEPTTQPQQASVAEWPPIPNETTNLSLVRIRYQAEVNEAAAARQKPSTPVVKEDNSWVWLIIALGAAIVLVVPAVFAGPPPSGGAAVSILPAGAPDL